MSIASLRGVDVGYGARLVLRDLTFGIAAGEAWAVLGPNGAGKSTLVRLLLGLVPPQRGTVEVCGLTPHQASAVERAKKVAWVPQLVRDDVPFTGLEVALMGRTPYLGPWGLPGQRDVEVARAALREFGVEHLEHRPLSQVSGGESRRVWLARAMVQTPQLLLLDEPTAFLDVKHQVEALRAVRRRLSPSFGALAVLHDVNLAMRFATHALLLRDGRALQAGPVADTLRPELLSDLYGIDMREVGGPGGAYVPRWEES